jgi:hypothetical protein
VPLSQHPLEQVALHSPLSQHLPLGHPTTSLQPAVHCFTVGSHLSPASQSASELQPQSCWGRQTLPSGDCLQSTQTSSEPQFLRSVPGSQTLEVLVQRPRVGAHNLAWPLTSQHSPLGQKPTQVLVSTLQQKPGGHSRPLVQAAGLHCPPRQLSLASQTRPQRPQLFRSVFRSVSHPSLVTPLQLSKPGLQVKRHWPFLQRRVAFGTLGQTLPHAPQLSSSFRSLRQSPTTGSKQKPASQVQVPRKQWKCCPHRRPQAPQFCGRCPGSCTCCHTASRRAGSYLGGPRPLPCRRPCRSHCRRCRWPESALGPWASGWALAFGPDSVCPSRSAQPRPARPRPPAAAGWRRLPRRGRRRSAAAPAAATAHQPGLVPARRASGPTRPPKGVPFAPPCPRRAVRVATTDRLGSGSSLPHGSRFTVHCWQLTMRGLSRSAGSRRTARAPAQPA